MKLTIEGSEAQVRDACLVVAGKLKPNKRGLGLLPDKRLRQEHIAARHLMIRRAFDIVRPDKSKREITSQLARVLGGSADLTEGRFEIACNICLETGEKADLDLVETAQAAHAVLRRAPSAA